MDANLQAHWEDTSTFPKILGSDPPGGEFFFQIFFQDFDLKYKGVMPLTQEK